MTDSASRHVRDWFDGPLMAGFECTNYIRRDGLRLDLMAATAHDAQAGDDYALVARQGMRCVRDGITWHRIEARPGHYDWSSFDAMVEAADRQATRVMWDLLHFGWPTWTGPLEPGFVARFAEFAARAVERVGPDAAFVPVNEISFLSWACGDDGFMHPHHQDRGYDVKQALCAAFIAAAEAIRSANPSALIATAEPLIAVLPVSVEDIVGARGAHEAQYQALDMLLGRRVPWLGGEEGLVDVIGFNHYPHSQWLHPTRQLPDTPRSLTSLLVECQARYPHPKFIAETGAEGDARVPWFDYVMAQVEQAGMAGVDLLATCLYPILNHLGWEDDRYCPNGLYCGVGPSRDIYQPLADAIAHYRTSCGVNHPMCVD
jgi:beta-glucosidase/6-phospho-beta-glucosidase/beta-galactosidase